MQFLKGDKKRFLLCTFAVIFFTIICHGYRYSNMSFSGDSSMLYQGGDEIYQVSLGRFLQPVYWMIRGKLAAPFLVGVFSTLFLLPAAVLIIDVLSITNPWSIFLACGILITNETLIVANATYLPWTDVYSLSFLFVCFGVAVCMKKKWGFLIAPFFFCLSLGLYGSYIACGATLLVLAHLVWVLEHRRLSEIWIHGLLSIFSLIAGMLLYWLVSHTLLKILGIGISYEYNGIGRIISVTPESILHLLPEVYAMPFQFFFNPVNRTIIASHRALISPVFNLLAAAVTLLSLGIAIRRYDFREKLTILFLLLVLPLAANFVVIISTGIVNGLMIYAYFFLYFVPILLIESLPQTTISKRMLSIASGVALSFILLVNVTEGNRLYIKRDLEFDATLSAFTRIMEHITDVEGYIPGETPVVLVGYLPSSAIAMERDGLADLRDLQGARYLYAASYESSTITYLQTIFGDRINLVPVGTRDAIASTEAVSNIPPYPEPGYMQLVDGVLIIKLF